MKRREMRYSDYNMSKQQVRELKEKCKKLDAEESIALLMCAMKANAGIAPALYFSLATGASYEEVDNAAALPISKGDFYAYRRYCLALFLLCEDVN